MWNFVVVSPGTISWNNWGGNGGSKPLTRILINLLSRLCGVLWSCPQALFPKITQAGRFLVESICMCFVFVASWSLTHVPANLSWWTSNSSSLRGYTKLVASRGTHGSPQIISLMSTTGTVSSETNLGHVLFGVSCAIQSLETCIAATKVFINLNVNVLQITEQHDQNNGYGQFYSTELSPRSPP